MDNNTQLELIKNIALKRPSGGPTASLKTAIDKWVAYIGRPLNKFEQRTVARPFLYREETKAWSRLLKPVWEGPPRGYVEVTLTPNGQDWNDLKKVLIRNVATSIDMLDVLADAPTQTVVKDIYANLGQEIAAILLYGHLFELIDWDLFKVKAYSPFYDGQGIPLFDVLNVGSDEFMED